MPSVLSSHVLALNRSWTPVQVTTVRRALTLVVAGAAQALDEDYRVYDFEDWMELSRIVRGGRRVYTPSMDILAPYVVILNNYDRVPRRRPRLSRRNIFARDNGTCQYCGKKPVRNELSIDHVVPRCKGGKSTWTNLVLACTSCNARKDDKSLHESGMKLLRKPEMPHWPFVGTIRIDARGMDFWSKFVSDAYWNAVLED